MPLIFPYQDEDQTECQNLLSEIFADDTVSKRYYRLCSDAQTFVARARGVVVGLGTAWHNSMHPYTWRCAVSVHPNHRRRGIGGMLLDEVSKGNHRQLPMITSLWETQIQGQQFARSHGFSEFRRTYTTALRLASLQTLSYRPWVDELNDHYHIVPIANITDEAQRQQIALLCKEVYVAAHRDNPPANLSIAQWMDLVFVDDLISHGSFIVQHQSEFVAVALLHRGNGVDTVELGWRGVTLSHRHRERTLMLATAVLQAEYAVSQGAQAMVLECDSTDPWSVCLIDMLPFSPSPAWVTLKRP